MIKTLDRISKLGILIFCFATITLLEGCATIVSGSHQVVNVQVIDSETHQIIKGASCTITNSKGISFPLNSNPGAISLPKEYGDLTVDCVAQHYYQSQIAQGSSFNAWTLGNIIFWPGAVVDAATGAAKKYPSHITVLMSRHQVKHPIKTIKAS